MSKLKKAMFSIMTIALILSGLALSFSAYATTYQELALDRIYSSSIEGGDDMIWYTYTPRESGTYSLISYSSGKTCAYLYVRTTNPDGSRTYTGLAYAPANDANYQEEGIQYFYNSTDNKTYTHYSTSFRLTYHLEAGTKYYFSAGYPYESTTRGTINTRLRQDSVDSDIKTLTEVSASCDLKLQRYCDGEWKTDSNGERYYEYNISKITQNMTITLHYSDGTSESGHGVDIIDGYKILYNFNQEENHWYDDNDPKHTENILTIAVGSVSCDFDVPIEVGPNYNVRGMITDYTTGEPVENAKIYWGQVYLGSTNTDGEFHFIHGCGTYFLTIEREDAYTREIKLTVSQNGTLNDHRADPILLLTGDYVRDGIINGKDIAYINKMLPAEVRNKETQKSCKQFALREAGFYKELVM